jgi:hypothetical protein
MRDGKTLATIVSIIAILKPANRCQPTSADRQQSPVTWDPPLTTQAAKPAHNHPNCNPTRCVETARRCTTTTAGRSRARALRCHHQRDLLSYTARYYAILADFSSPAKCRETTFSACVVFHLSKLLARHDVVVRSSSSVMNRSTERSVLFNSCLIRFALDVDALHENSSAQPNAMRQMRSIPDLSMALTRRLLNAECAERMS